MQVIKAKNNWWQLDWKELWQFRVLFYFLAWRDIKVKYKQTIIGVVWAVFTPFATMVVFSIFFGKLANMPSLFLKSRKHSSKIFIRFRLSDGHTARVNLL